MLRQDKSLTGYRVGARDGDLGRIEYCLFDDEVWVVRFFVVDLTDWQPGRSVVLPPSVVGCVDEAANRLVVPRMKDEVRWAPDVNVHKPVAKQREAERLELAPRGGAARTAGLWGGGFYASLSAASALGDEVQVRRRQRPGSMPGDPHLRSCREVTGYRVRGTDGDIGRVEGFVLDDENWAIRYLVVDAGRKRTGAFRLLGPLLIARVSWAARSVFTDLPKAAVETAPPFDPSTPLTRELEATLHEHYDTPVRWASSRRTARRGSCEKAPASEKPTVPGRRGDRPRPSTQGKARGDRRVS